MNLKLIDTALSAYRGKLDEADIARLEFFRKIWGVQAALVEEQARIQDYVAPTADEFACGEASVFSQKGVVLKTDAVTSAVERVLACFVEHKGFGESIREALSSVKWDRLVAASSLDLAGSKPAAYTEQIVSLLVDDGLDERSTEMGGQAMALALRALLETPATVAARALREDAAAETHSLCCPVCGGIATVARVGDSQAVQGRGKELWCAQCGTTWDFERVRCARCGTQNQSHLHFFNIEGDDAHRLAMCDECGGYVRTVFQADALAPFAFEVEDVLMAKLDLVAYQQAAADAAKSH